MRILYCTPESPLFPAGGIGTYIGEAAAAMSDAGHDVYLLTWTPNPLSRPLTYAPFVPQNCRILTLPDSEVYARFPDGPLNIARSMVLAEALGAAVEEWEIDVVESCEYTSPCLTYFQQRRTRKNARPVVLATFNHGLLTEAYIASGIFPDVQAEADLVGERQQLRISDIVLTPTQHSLKVLRAHGIRSPAAVVAEPYRFERCDVPQRGTGRLVHLGRVSIAKGIDQVIFFINLIAEEVDISHALFVGQVLPTPYRETDIAAYIRRRLRARHIELEFTGGLSREAAKKRLSPGDIQPSFSLSETFCFAMIEGLDRGTIPFVKEASAMAEFFPEHLRRYVLPADLGDFEETRKLVANFIAHAEHHVSELQEFNRARCDPGRFAMAAAKEYDRILQAKRTYRDPGVFSPPPARASGSDVTILMPCFEPDEQIFDAIASISKQSVRPREVILCDDGSSRSAQAYLAQIQTQWRAIKIIRQPNHGLLGARNTLIRNCETKLSIFLDFDDFLSDSYIERCLEAYNSSSVQPNAVLTHRKNFGDNNETVIRTLLGDYIHFMRNDYRMTALIETDVLQAIGFDASRRNGEADDWIFWLQFTNLGYHAETVPEPLFNYQMRIGSMSWPWSSGQASGTAEMLADTFAAFIVNNPDEVAVASRVMYNLRALFFREK